MREYKLVKANEVAVGDMIVVNDVVLTVLSIEPLNDGQQLLFTHSDNQRRVCAADVEVGVVREVLGVKPEQGWIPSIWNADLWKRVKSAGWPDTIEMPCNPFSIDEYINPVLVIQGKASMSDLAAEFENLLTAYDGAVANPSAETMTFTNQCGLSGSFPINVHAAQMLVANFVIAHRGLFGVNHE